MNELRARVVSQEKGRYTLQSGTEVKPAVGDYVIAEQPRVISAKELLHPKSSGHGKAGTGHRRQPGYRLSLYVAEQQL